MKRKRIQYNELNEEIYGPKYWTRARLIAIGAALLIFGFIFNFSVEEKVNKWLLATLSGNDACPIIFEKAELSYFLPKIIIKKPVILGSCFGQVNNRLPLQNITISFHSPSFYPPGVKLHTTIAAGKTLINAYPILSPFSQYIDIEDSKIDTALFAAMTVDNTSPLSGILALEGSLKMSSGMLEGGKLSIQSKNLTIPAQNLKGFDVAMLNLKHLNIQAQFVDNKTLQISQVELGQPGSPMEMKLSGTLLMNPVFLNSKLQLAGTLHVTTYMMTNFEILKLFLPQENQSGNYQMKIEGPLGNLGTPQFK